MIKSNSTFLLVLCLSILLFTVYYYVKAEWAPPAVPPHLSSDTQLQSFLHGETPPVASAKELTATLTTLHEPTSPDPRAAAPTPPALPRRLGGPAFIAV